MSGRKTPIEPGDIRKGDLIRQEWASDTEDIWVLAVEYVAVRDEDQYWEASWAKSFLLERPVVLPTRPYSMAIPPEGYPYSLTPFVLTPARGESMWERSGRGYSFNHVKSHIRQGWRIIEGPEVLP